jgi:hypothetical protein
LLVGKVSPLIWSVRFMYSPMERDCGISVV